MQHSHFFKKDRTKVSPYPWIRRTTQPAFWPAARLRRTSVSAAGGNLGAEQIYFARAFEIPKGGGRLRRPEPKKKDTTFVVSFFLDAAPFGISMPCRSKPSLRNCLVLRTCEFTAHQRRRSEDRSDISIAQILTGPSTSEQVLYRLLRLIL